MGKTKLSQKELVEQLEIRKEWVDFGAKQEQERIRWEFEDIIHNGHKQHKGFGHTCYVCHILEELKCRILKKEIKNG